MHVFLKYNICTHSQVILFLFKSTMRLKRCEVTVSSSTSYLLAANIQQKALPGMGSVPLQRHQLMAT